MAGRQFRSFEAEAEAEAEVVCDKSNASQITDKRKLENIFEWSILLQMREGCRFGGMYTSLGQMQRNQRHCHKYLKTEQVGKKKNWSFNKRLKKRNCQI